MENMENMEKALLLLKKYFGYTSFRTGQAELINAILQGSDCLGIMPTGSGKSICYQIPALMLEGTTLVISPLISLMKDQVDNLNEIGVIAFAECEMLEGFDGGNGITQIGAGAFDSCVSLQSVKIPPKVREVSNIFIDCSSLEELTFGEETEVINSLSLQGCKGLKKVSLSSNISHLPEMAFQDCEGLEEVEVDGTNRISYGVFQGKSSIRKVKIDGQEFELKDNEQLFSFQKVGEKVAIVVRDEKGKYKTQCVNLERRNRYNSTRKCILVK